MSEIVHEQLGLLNQQVNKISAMYHQAIQNNGLSDGEFWIFYALIFLGGEYSQQDICNLWSLPKQTVNSIINKMKKKEYVFLEVNPKNRNRKFIRLTEKGKKLGEDVVSRIYNAEERTIGQMSVQERELMISLLGKYLNFLGIELEVKKGEA